MLRAQSLRRPQILIEELRGQSWAITALAVLLSLGAIAMIALLGATATAALVIGVVILLMTLAEPRYGLYLVVLTVPMQQYASVRGLTATQAAFFLVLGAWVAGKLLRGARWDVVRDRNLWFFVLFSLAILSSIRVAGNVRLSLTEAFHWGEALAVYAIARDTLRTRRDWAWLIAVFFLGASGEAFIGTIQSKLGLGNRSFVVGDISRAFGTFGRPNSYAGYLEMIVPFAITLSIWALANLPRATGDWVRRVNAPLHQERRAALWAVWVLIVLGAAGATALMLAAAITLSLSRGAWLGVAAALLVMLVLTGKRGAVCAIAATLLLAVTIALGGAGALPKSLQERVSSAGGSLVLLDYFKVPITNENFAVKERMAYWIGGLRMIHDHPWQGVGLGNYGPEYNAKYYVPPFMISQVHAHNYYIHIAAETGVIGLAAYLVLIGGVLAAGIGAVRRTAQDPFARALAIAGVGVVVAVAVHNLFEDLHVLSMGVQLSAVWALLAAIRGDSRIPFRSLLPPSRVRATTHGGRAWQARR